MLSSLSYSEKDNHEIKGSEEKYYYTGCLDHPQTETNYQTKNIQRKLCWAQVTVRFNLKTKRQLLQLNIEMEIKL